VYLDSLDPSTGAPFAQVPDSDAADIDAAVAAASAAFPAWSATLRTERSKIMNRIADLLEARLDEFALLESRDQGL
jgi:aminomuconate-semialdehyde/2-hydroxymuconate-6-semialdehyde dehydrogenase